ncbi:hypothetical protein CF15_02095 [Pyrodictium occultum]|uniref:ATPase BadF/BadG/BcrA/BcrD type domain-containing protein n=1 Tax=Pyrodictium occultum TaxID=2309 RepID=A0A0V8RU94_PYROC|nr:BadF/BadG/BcrA/BcrD ATPase family protein [Pyrodictium occultum]KSW11641.1 hypothetical protein CF15_02095 [Pyrodictium occultum]
MLVAGVDAGATRTRALVYDTGSGGVWAGSAGPGNPVNVGAASAGAAVREAVEAALRGTGHRASRVSLVVAGFAGLDSRLLAGQLAGLIASASGYGGRLVVEHDAHIALVHATGGGPGALVIAGTGSIAYALTPRGERIIVGDHGWLLGDEGSGFWVAREALRTLLRALDGRGEHSCLTRVLASTLGVTSGDELAYWFYLTRGRVDKIASLAPRVAEAAEEGCMEARSILERGAVELAEAARVAAEKAGAEIVYTTGSMFKSRVFAERFRRELEAHGIGVSGKRVYPVVGALMLALERLGLRRERDAVAEDPVVLEAARGLYEQQ